MLAAAKRPLFVALSVDEERFQHPAIRVPDVRVDEIGAFVSQVPETTVVLNGFKTSQVPELFEMVGNLDHVVLDTRLVEGGGARLFHACDVGGDGTHLVGLVLAAAGFSRVK